MMPSVVNASGVLSARHTTSPFAPLIFLIAALLAVEASAEPPEVEAFRFGIAADTNVNNDRTEGNLREILHDARERGLHFVLILGDLVNKGDNQDQWRRFRSVLADAPLPVFTAMGNHDVTTEVWDQTDMARRVWSDRSYREVTGVPANHVYSIGPVRIVAMYSGGLRRDGLEWQAFLEEAMAEVNADADAEWIFVADHFGPTSPCLPHGTPMTGGYDRPAAIQEAMANAPEAIWLSGDLGNRFTHRPADDSTPWHEFTPRESRKVPAYAEIELLPDGVMRFKPRVLDGTRVPARVEIQYGHGLGKRNH